MRKYTLMSCTLAAALVFSLSPLSAGEMPSADATKVWSYITETSPYLGWGFWPGYTEIYLGKSPHGKFLKLYANAPALQAAREGKPMPEGAIIVKENYGKDKKTLMAVTPMYKVNGYNPEAGDWFWAKYDLKGKALKAGKVKGCIDCHRTQEGKGWLFTEPK